MKMKFEKQEHKVPAMLIAIAIAEKILGLSISYAFLVSLKNNWFLKFLSFLCFLPPALGQAKQEQEKAKGANIKE